MALARADLESLLRTRQLDRTLTTAQPVLRRPAPVLTNTPSPRPVLTALDARLGGGFPRGQLSELVGPRSSGRTSRAAADARGGHRGAANWSRSSMRSTCSTSSRRRRPASTLDRVALDPRACGRPPRALPRHEPARDGAGDPGAHARAAGGQLRPGRVRCRRSAGRRLARLPFTTWLRLQRMVEGSQTSVPAGRQCADGAQPGGADAEARDRRAGRRGTDGACGV